VVAERRPLVVAWRALEALLLRALGPLLLLDLPLVVAERRALEPLVVAWRALEALLLRALGPLLLLDLLPLLPILLQCPAPW
jgi:hypothetical protein